MKTNQILALVALSANGALAANHRRHLHHHDKKAIVYESTETVTDITWVTVTVGNGGETVGATSTQSIITPTAVASTSSSVTTPTAVASTPSTSSSVVVPSTTSSATTLVTSTKAASSAEAPTSSEAATSSVFDTPGINVAEAASTYSTSTAEAATTEAPTTIAVASSTYVASSAAAATTAASSSSSGNKRGAAYNTASLISPLLGDGTKLSWAYNWGSSSDGLSDISSSLEYVPMLWGTGSDHTSYWSSNAQSAISAGSSHLVSFNEPDNSGQSNLTPAEAATGHQTYMNPFADQARIGAPAITNSNIAGESIDWLSSWIDSCGGSCSYDFCPAHWYNTIDAGADDLLSFVKKVYDTCGKPVWITEFEPTDGSDEEKASFLQTVQEAFDSDEYSYVERYSYFMVADGNLVSGGSASTFGSTFAYS